MSSTSDSSATSEVFRRGMELLEQKDLPGAAAAFDKAADRARTLPIESRMRQLPRALWRGALVHHELGDTALAMRLGTEAVALWERGPQTQHEAAARACADMSTIALAYGDGAQAVAFGRSAVAHAIHLSDTDEVRGTAWHVLAAALLATDAVGEAGQSAATAYEIRRRRSDRSTHPSLADWELTNTMLLVASVAGAQGRVDVAAAAAAEAVELATTLGAAGAPLLVKALALSQQLRPVPARHREPNRYADERDPFSYDPRRHEPIFVRSARAGVVVGLAAGGVVGWLLGSWLGLLVGLYCGVTSGLSVGRGAAGVVYARSAAAGPYYDRVDQGAYAAGALAAGVGSAGGAAAGVILAPGFGLWLAAGALIGYAVGGAVLGGAVGWWGGRPGLPIGMSIVPTAGFGAGVWLGTLVGEVTGFPALGVVLAFPLAYAGWSVAATYTAAVRDDP